MIKLDISGVHFDVDPKLEDYVEQKIGKLDRYIPRQARGTSHGEVILTEEDGKAKNRFICEVNITLPHDQLTAREATLNMFAAVDIVEAKIKSQILKYKEKHVKEKRRATLFWKSWRRG